MRVSKCLGLLAVVLLLGGTALAQAPYVYVSNPLMAEIIGVDPATETKTLLFDDKKLPIGDLALSPEGMLYACVPAEGLIFAFNSDHVGDPLTLQSTGVTKIYEYDGNGPVSPQCGWFTKDGGLLVNDTLGNNGTWLIDVSNGTASQILGGFSGQGVTQAGNGALLVSNSSDSEVTSTPIDLLTGAFLPSAIPLFSEPSPIGIARSSRDVVFVATGNQVVGYSYDRDEDQWNEYCALPFGVETPKFLEFTTDDTLYVASTSADLATLWSVTIDPDTEPYCTKTEVTHWIKEQGYKPALSGVAVEMASTESKRTKDLDGDGEDDLASHEYFLNFYDHALEIVGSEDCNFTATAHELAPSFVENLITLTPNPLDPDCWVPPGDDGDGTCDPIGGEPVVAFGAGGYAFAYDVSFDSGCEYYMDLDGFPTAINAYTGYVPNPRIGRCDTCDADTFGDCELLDLYSYFPYNGLFPKDGRIASRSDTFSCLFLLDADLNELGNYNTGDGRWCGFTPPMSQPTGYNYDPRDPDPEILDNELFVAALPTFSTTETVPFKFRIADLEYGGNCTDGPFNANAAVMFAIAKVATLNGDGTVADKVFVPKEVYPANSSDPVAPAYFNDPASPTQYYHFNAKFPGYEAGVYQMVLVAISNNFNAVVVYFKVQP